MDPTRTPESDTTPAKAPRKRAARKTATSPAQVAKGKQPASPRARKGATAKAAAPKTPSITRRRHTTVAADVPSPAEFTDMIATAAYYLAERRGFTPGHELEDWLTAEYQIRELAGTRTGQI